jgi:uncharacterized membrane protein (UPF0127 family)
MFSSFANRNIRHILLLVFLLSQPLGARESAQPELPAVTLRVGKAAIRAEVADDDTERSCGLMFRTALARDSGMLFVMPVTGPASFWMKNTLIPLSIAFIAPDGAIMEIHDMKPGSEEMVRSAFPRIAYALEMEQGWFSKNNIWPGERVSGLPPPAPGAR